MYVHFDNTFVFQNLLKDEPALKILACSNPGLPSPALVVLLFVNKFSDQLAPNVPKNILRNPPFVLPLHCE